MYIVPTGAKHAPLNVHNKSFFHRISQFAIQCDLYIMLVYTAALNIETSLCRGRNGHRDCPVAESGPNYHDYTYCIAELQTTQTVLLYVKVGWIYYGWQYNTQWNCCALGVNYVAEEERRERERNKLREEFVTATIIL